MKTEWTKPQRSQFIGGSDARIIVGNDEATMRRLWREKRGEEDSQDLSGNLVVQFGLATECPAAEAISTSRYRLGMAERFHNL